MLRPNLGKDASWEDVFQRFSGSALGDYLKKVADKVSGPLTSPSMYIPRNYSSRVRGLLEKTDGAGALSHLVARLSLEGLLEQEISHSPEVSCRGGHSRCGSTRCQLFSLTR